MSIDTATGQTAPAEVSSERVYQIFSTIAQRYELFNTVSSMGFYRKWLRGMVKQASIKPESDVLDIAGGTGDVSFAVARMKRPAHIQLTDFVPEMLAVARQRAEKGAGCDTDIDFAIVDAQEIPYADNSYDVVTMAYGIRNIPDREKALSEILRVLKPGGTLVCLEFSTPRTKVMRLLYGFYLKRMIPFWGGLITGNKEGFVYLANSINAFPDQQGYADMLEQAGFSQVSWKDYSGGIAAVHTGVKP